MSIISPFLFLIWLETQVVGFTNSLFSCFINLCINLNSIEEMLKIEIKPGWMKGKKNTCAWKGNQELGVTTFCLQEGWK